MKWLVSRSASWKVRPGYSRGFQSFRRSRFYSTLPAIGDTVPRRLVFALKREARLIVRKLPPAEAENNGEPQANYRRMGRAKRK